MKEFGPTCRDRGKSGFNSRVNSIFPLAITRFLSGCFPLPTVTAGCAYNGVLSIYFDLFNVKVFIDAKSKTPEMDFNRISMYPNVPN